jgi:glyoxylase-like metal-dependent hydrolase (beta-lactamase superfamily II)
MAPATATIRRNDMASPDFDRSFDPAYGHTVPLAPGVERLTVNNPSAFTFHGTNSYIVGSGRSVAVIDPGPDSAAHFETLMAALGRRSVSHIFVSHTHRDHSPLARRLQQATGAITVGQGPHRPARPLHDGEINPFDESADLEFVPDLVVADDETVLGDGFSLTALLTPGHCANHACFALEGAGIVFSADHVMAWATSVVAPPDGAMADYMASLERMLGRNDKIFYPGHGGPVREPAAFMRGLRTHRRMRERAIFERIKAGDRLIVEMVQAIYRDTDRRLHGAAGLSVLAHLEDLVEKGLVATDGPPSLLGAYRPAC